MSEASWNESSTSSIRDTLLGGTDLCSLSRSSLFTPPVINGLGLAGFQPMYQPGGGVLSFPAGHGMAPRLTALAVLGVVFPGLSLAALGCSIRHGTAYLPPSRFRHLKMRSSLSQHLRWRATIAWLHFLEPIALGTPKGGLTPGAVSPRGRRDHRDGWWQRLQPLACGHGPGGKRGLGQICLASGSFRQTRGGLRGGTEPHPRRLTFGCVAVPSEAKILAVVGTRGGPKRQARVSAVVRPSIRCSGSRPYWVWLEPVWECSVSLPRPYCSPWLFAYSGWPQCCTPIVWNWLSLPTQPKPLRNSSFQKWSFPAKRIPP